MTNPLVNLVHRDGQQAFTTSLVVAAGCDNRSHESTIKLIRKYRADFESLGKLDFKSDEILSKHGKQTEYALLNEDQATFLITLFRNTPTVLKFKLNLVKAFRSTLNEISRLYANPPRDKIVADKRASHWDMTGALKELRADQGKDTTAVHYMSENKLCNGVVTGNFKKVDEKALNNTDLHLLELVRKRNAALIMADIPYDERKKRLIAYALKQRTALLA